MKKETLKIVYMGTSEFSGEILKSLINEKWNVIGIVCQPDKEVGRKKEFTFPPTKKIAISHGIETFQPYNIRKDHDWIKEKKPDIIITCAYGQIVSQDVLDIPPLHCINIHGSLLPKLRGAAPIQRAILDDYSETGITIMEMVREMDAGKMYLKAKIDVSNDDTGDSLFKKLEIIASKLILDFLPKYINNGLIGEEQNTSEVTFAPSIKREEEKINWEDTKRNIYNKIRAFNSVPGAYTILDDTIIKIWKSEEVNEEYFGQNGEVVDVLKDKIIVKVRDGAIAIKELQVAGKRKMLVQEYLNGNKNLKGKIFHE